MSMQDEEIVAEFEEVAAAQSEATENHDGKGPEADDGDALDDEDAHDDVAEVEDEDEASEA